MTFSTVAGWNTPSSQQITIASGQNTASASYVRQTGSLAVTITPSSAQWTITDSNNNTWQGSGNGTPVGNIPTGPYTMTFSTVAGWSTPAPQTITIMSGSNTASGTYVQQFNSLTGDHRSRHSRECPRGGRAVEHRRRYHLVRERDYDQPYCRHDRPYGNLQARYGLDHAGTPADPDCQQSQPGDRRLHGPDNTARRLSRGHNNPEGRQHPGAYWQVDGGSWQQSGAKVTDLATGHHVVTFLPVDGWTAPSSRTITIAKNQPTSISAAYVELVGSLKVSISPQSAVNAGAKWSIDGGTTWHESGATLTNVQITTTNPYTVTFKPVTGWTTAPNQTQITITKGQTVVLTSAENVYTRQTGSLTVSFADPAPAGAEWSIDGGTHWNAGGAQLNNLPTGYYTVTFKSVYGWDTPGADKNVQVEYNVNKTVTGITYAQQHGTLKVIISPSSVAEGGATWQVDGGTAEVSGATVILTVGTHNVTFSTYSGWTAPGTKTVTINKNALTPIQRYLQEVGGP